MSWLLWWNNFT